MLTEAARKFQAARNTYATLDAAVKAIHAAADEAYPTPPNDCDESTFDRWNDAYEDYCADNGLYDAIDARRAAAEPLITTCIQYCVESTGLTPEQCKSFQVAIEAALGKGRRFNIRAHERLVELALVTRIV